MASNPETSSQSADPVPGENTESSGCRMPAMYSGSAADQNSVEMPRPTASPLILGLGLTLLAAGATLGLAFLVVGALLLVTGLGMWLAQLSSDRGHLREARAEPARRPMPVTTQRESVEQLRPGMPG